MGFSTKKDNCTYFAEDMYCYWMKKRDSDLKKEFERIQRELKRVNKAMAKLEDGDSEVAFLNQVKFRYRNELIGVLDEVRARNEKEIEALKHALEKSEVE
jgi:hypothetical protein